MKNFLCFLLYFYSIVAFAHTSLVTGRIKNDRGEPLSFASVKFRENNYSSDVLSAGRVPGSDVLVAQCDGIVSVKLHHTSPSADYRNYIIILKKK